MIIKTAFNPAIRLQLSLNHEGEPRRKHGRTTDHVVIPTIVPVPVSYLNGGRSTLDVLMDRWGDLKLQQIIV